MTTAAMALRTPAIARGLVFTDFIRIPPKLQSVAVITRKSMALGLSVFAGEMETFALLRLKGHVSFLNGNIQFVYFDFLSGVLSLTMPLLQ